MESSDQSLLGTDAKSSINCLEDFVPATMSEIKKVIEGLPNKSCELDPIPTCLLK